MRQVFKIALIAATLATGLGFSAAEAADPKLCKVVTNDIGTIVGQGATKDEAFEDAATKCFDRRTQLFRTKYQRSIDSDTGELYIDICANIKCS